MARLIKPLTATQVNNAKAKDTMYKMFDGGGLFLQVNPSGGKHWKMKYRKADGKEGLLTFGSYPEISLEQARKLRDEARAHKAAGLDPGVIRKEEKAELANRAKNTFEAIARAWLDVHATKVQPQSLAVYSRLLETVIIPSIGKRPIKEMKAPDFLALLRNLEDSGQVYKANRAANVCSMIMRFAVATGQADSDPLPALSGSLKKHPRKHMAAMIDPKEVGRLLRTIDAYGGSFTVRSALQIAPYVFVRPTELRHARWEDIDFEAREWRYTATKTKTQHIVPLAPQVMEILQKLRALSNDCEWVFPDLWRSGPMGRSSMVSALRSMGIGKDEMSAHGFRAIARTLLDEVLGERYDLIEQQLAHMVRDPNGRAYNRTTHLPERRKMMERWAKYLDELRADIPKVK